MQNDAGSTGRDMALDPAAQAVLRRLANHQGITHEEAMQRALDVAERVLLADLSLERLKDYFGSL